MIYLKKAIGVYYQQHQIDIVVAGRTFSSMEHLGSLRIADYDQKEPFMVKSDIEKFLAELNVTPENIVVVLTPDEVTYRRLVLPTEVEDNLKEAVRLQMLNIVPAEADEYCFEYITRAGDEEDVLEVDLFLLPREKVLKSIEFLKSIGLPPDAVTLNVFGLEKLLAQNRELAEKPVFLVDLETASASIYLFEKGSFSSFRHSLVRPETTELLDILKEVERCSAERRLADDTEIELIFNFSDPAWAERLPEQEPAQFRGLATLAPFDNFTDETLHPGLAAVCGLGKRKKVPNLIPPELRKRSSAANFVPTAILAIATLLLLLANFSRGYIQEANYIHFLEENITKYQDQHREVMRVRRNIEDIRKEIETYQQVLQKPLSDLLILAELTEKVSEKTYLQQYIRSDNLEISGYTDSYQNLTERVETIPLFKSITQRGSITKKGDLENFHLIIQLEEQQ